MTDRDFSDEGFERDPLRSTPARPAATPPASAGSPSASSDDAGSSSSSADDSATKKRRRTSSTTAEEFTGPPANLQVRLPQDLVQSLRLHSIQTGRTISEIVLEALTTDATITKAWVSTRRAG